jgi:hypothetical protein
MDGSFTLCPLCLRTETLYAAVCLASHLIATSVPLQGLFVEAREHCKMLLRTYPDHVENIFMLGMVLFALEDYEMYVWL